MKKNILLVLAVMILVRCGYLDDYLEVYIYPARKKYKI